MGENVRDGFIRVGFEIFARFGPEKFTIQNISKAFHRERTGFYYYFTEWNYYVSQVHRYAVRQAEEVNGILMESQNIFDAIKNVFEAHPYFTKFVFQVFKHSADPKYLRLYRGITDKYKLVASGLVCKELGIDCRGDEEEQIRIYHLLLGSFYLEYNLRPLTKESYQQTIKYVIETFLKTLNK